VEETFAFQPLFDKYRRRMFVALLCLDNNRLAILPEIIFQSSSALTNKYVIVT